MINTASKLYNELLNIYTTRCDNLSEDQKKKINILNRPEILTLDFDEDDLPSMPPLDSDEEVKIKTRRNYC